MKLDLEDIVRAAIAIIFVGVFAYLAITGRETSQSFQTILLMVIGFYFGINELGKVAAKYYTSRKNGVK